MISPPEFSPDETNPHFLQRIVDLSRDNPVTAREDIYDVRGVKLLPRGGQLNEEIYERLIRFRLKKPVELSIAAEEPIEISQLCMLLEEMLDTMSGLSRALAKSNADLLVREIIQRITLDPTSSLYLALQRQESGQLRHSLLVALLAIAMGHKLGNSMNALTQIATAGVLHDVGEVFIDPHILRKQGRLSPQEWRHIACHPLLGAMTMRTTLGLPEPVARAVAEHHERLNGYGYPRLLAGSQISFMGSLIGAAEQTAAMIQPQDHGSPHEMLGTALKLISGEFPTVSISFADQIYRSVCEETQNCTTSPRNAGNIANGVMACLQSTRAGLDDTRTLSCSPGLATFIRQRLDIIERALFSAGIPLQQGNESISGHSDAEQRESGAVLQVLAQAIQEIPYLATLHAEASQSRNTVLMLARSCNAPIPASDTI